MSKHQPIHITQLKSKVHVKKSDIQFRFHCRNCDAKGIEDNEHKVQGIFHCPNCGSDELTSWLGTENLVTGSIKNICLYEMVVLDE